MYALSLLAVTDSESLTGILLAGIGAMGGVVIAMWKVISAYTKKAEEREKRIGEKLDKCEERHVEKDKDLLDLTARVASVEGKVSAWERVERKIDSLHEESLKGEG